MPQPSSGFPPLKANCSQDLAIEKIELLLQNKCDETEDRIEHAQVLQLLKFCLRTYFTVDGTVYEQVKGTRMGSPISGLIAEAVLQRLESLVFQHHKRKFLARHVDDTFVVIDRDQLLTFKERLNAIFPDIQFTMEEEENNQLAFLDVLWTFCKLSESAIQLGIGFCFTRLAYFCALYEGVHAFSCLRPLWVSTPLTTHTRKHAARGVVAAASAPTGTVS
nr:unnamed protein product [Spirometra erinaceieuropaei]